MTYGEGVAATVTGIAVMLIAYLMFAYVIGASPQDVQKKCGKVGVASVSRYVPFTVSVQPSSYVVCRDGRVKTL